MTISRPVLARARKHWLVFVQDPYSTFLIGIIACLILSYFLAGRPCHPMYGPAPNSPTVQNVESQVTSSALVSLMAESVRAFVNFPPLGVVLVALMGVSVADKSGYLLMVMRVLVKSCPSQYLTPVVVIIGLLSRTGADSGYIIVPAFAAMAFAASRRHPIAGLAVSFAAVSGSIGANILPSAVDPLLQAFTERAASGVAPGYSVSPLCNYWFSLGSACFLILICWFITDRYIEPQLKIALPPTESVDANGVSIELARKEIRAFAYALLGLAIVILCFSYWIWRRSPIWRYPAMSLVDGGAPLMQSLVPMILLFFLVPGTIYGICIGKFKESKDIFKPMIDGISDASSFVVLCFVASILTQIIVKSNLALFVAWHLAAYVQKYQLAILTIAGVFIIVVVVNYFIPSASAKWAILAPLFVPLLMRSGEGPEATQALYRVATASTSTISPFLPYIPILASVVSRVSGGKANYAMLVRYMYKYSLVLSVGWLLVFLVWRWLKWPYGIVTHR